MPAEAPSTTASTDTAYDPGAIEDKWYEYWEAQGYFHAEVDKSRDPHVIMIPPPNVTGRLHMGHALQFTVQDSLTRLRRLQGYEALWMPGKDHAGIATQNVVERTIKEEEGKSRHDLGREKFVERIWDWKEEYGDIISAQMRKLGVSCDWPRERFTMDDGFSRAVQEVFVKLYEEGLIYRGDYLVNWDPANETALSNEEVDNVEREGKLWYVRYPLLNGAGHVTIATTRPETMLGDTAVAVHPDDERYEQLIGKQLVLPLLERRIPVVADDYVDRDFGAGALKVTPGHDENDFSIGKKHDLACINIMNKDGTINEEGGPYAGLDRFDAREKIVDDLKEAGLLERVETIQNTIPVSSRSGAVIEPLISRQWFVKMKPLAEPAIEAVRSGEVTFYPERWENEYFRWMENIRDWVISRQLWWGHRIPVWYYTDDEGAVDEDREFVVAVDQPEAGMVQDRDVLDTWFSSWLWPFATLGWPEETEELSYFYPTSVLVSGYDILFFWIARMVMAGYHFTGKKPFSDIFITGMVKDAQGRWMSKSLGNGIDPLEMIDKYGADAVRFSLTILCAQGQDIKLDPSKFEMGRNFANKVWNAYNVFGQFKEDGRDYHRERDFEELELVERWMLHRLNGAIRSVEESLERYRLNEALSTIYDLFWHDYCDWYLELIKPPWTEDGSETMEEDTIALAIEIYEQIMVLLHPFMPFITEELWWRLRPRAEGETCMQAAWPEVNDGETDEEGAALFDQMQSLIASIRTIKSDYGVPLHKDVDVVVKVGTNGAISEHIAAHESYFHALAGVQKLEAGTDEEKPKASASAVAGRHEVYIPLAGMVDIEQEQERLRKEIAQKAGFLKSVERKLENQQFVERAPEEIVEREREKARDTRATLERLKANLNDLA